jgi:hypothetical protein
MTRQRNFARIGGALVCSIVLLGILSQNLAQIDLPTWTPNGFPVMFRSSESGSKWDDRGADDNICTVEDIVYGEWMDDKPLGSMEEVTERYQLAVSEHFSFAQRQSPRMSSFFPYDSVHIYISSSLETFGLSCSSCSCPIL